MRPAEDGGTSGGSGSPTITLDGGTVVRLGDDGVWIGDEYVNDADARTMLLAVAVDKHKGDRTFVYDDGRAYVAECARDPGTRKCSPLSQSAASILNACVRYEGLCSNDLVGQLKRHGAWLREYVENGFSRFLGKLFSRWIRPGSAAGLLAEVDADGILNLYIKTGSHTPRGGEMFREAVEWVGGPGNINGIRGTWVRGEGLRDNIDSFNAAVRSGLPLEEAAFSTFTGKMAYRFGFSRAEFEVLRGTPGEYTNVGVVFRR
jgi:hypothetical protein